MDTTLTLIKNAEYRDIFTTVIIDKSITPEESTEAFFNTFPQWGHYLMVLRNWIVKYFGLETSDDTERKIITCPPKLKKGDRVAFFEVIERTNNSIYMGATDKHLCATVGIILCKIHNKTFITIETEVVFHNRFGHIYFWIIKPFHILLIKHCLCKMEKSLAN